LNVFLVGFTIIALLLCTSAQSKALIADSGIAAQALKNCKTDLRYLNQVVGWQVKWPRQWQNLIKSGHEAANNAITSWSQSPKALATAVDKLRLGMQSDETVPHIIALRVKQQINDLLSELANVNSQYIFKNTEHKNAAQWNSLIQKEVVPAITRFYKFLNNEYLPVTNKTYGLSTTNGGSECFFNAVTWWTTLDLSVDEVEAIGMRFIKESKAQLLATGEKGETVSSMLTKLRNTTKDIDPKELLAISEKALDRAHRKTLESFSKRSNKKIVVREMPKYMQKSAPAGYYGRSQGDSPARYIINPSRPNERRLMAEVIAFHEGMPGHHLWASYPRKEPSAGYNSGILEGWALYSEYLSDEMELYSTTYDRQGMITKHLWAASRLIVEPGLHLRGWSREDAIQFMLENTVMSRTEIEIEVDRYIAMPGQSLSYILGADLIMSERKRAQDILGDGFALSDFHDVVLEPGVRPLPQVRKDIRTWVKLANQVPVNKGH